MGMLGCRARGPRCPHPAPGEGSWEVSAVPVGFLGCFGQGHPGVKVPGGSCFGEGETEAWGRLGGAQPLFPPHLSFMVQLLLLLLLSAHEGSTNSTAPFYLLAVGKWMGK